MKTDLYVVGIGPGGIEGMTIEAYKVLEKCDVLAGYTTYAELVKDSFTNKEWIVTPMRKEKERCILALESAENGKTTAMICSGDSGIYGMAGLILELSKDYPNVNVRVIAGVTAAASGAAFLCYVTPAEHLRLPNAADVKEGIIAAKIAAHAADIAKGIPHAADWDYKMSEARKRLDWEEMFRLSMDPEKARRYRAEAKPEKEDTCSMCGNFCAVKNTNRILDGEIVSIFDE